MPNFRVVTAVVLLFSAVKSQQFNSVSNYCPQGTQPYSGGASITCQVAGAYCAAGFICQRPTSGTSNSLFCCSGVAQGLSSYCPNGGQPQIAPAIPGATGPADQIPQSCSSASCSPGYTCQPSTFGGLSYCCSNSLNTNGAFNDGNTNGFTSSSNSAYQTTYNSANNNLNGYTNRYNDNGFNNGYTTSYNNNGGTVFNNGYGNINTPYNSGNPFINPYVNSNIAVITAENNDLAAGVFCPIGATPWYYPGTQYVPACVVGFSICPFPSTCQSSTGINKLGFPGACCYGLG